MTSAMISELLIALFAGIVVVVTFRRHTPRAVELAAWAGLIWVCVLGLASAREEHARALTSAAVWGGAQMVGTVTGLVGQGASGWIVGHRFAIADWVVLLFGADVLALALLASRRQAEGWTPVIKLRDWMELPRPGVARRPAPTTVSAADEINQRFNTWAPVAIASALTWFTLFLIWTGDVVMPGTFRGARKAAQKAGGARRRVASAGWHGLVEKVGTEPRRLTDQVVDLDVIVARAAAIRAKAADWLTEVGTAPEIDWTSGCSPLMRRGNEEDVTDEQDRRHRLAS
jgi:hypothetical protein